MFSWRRKAVQAKRKQPTRQAETFHWRKSWNALLLLPLFAVGGYQLTQLDDFMPIRGIVLVGSFEQLERTEIEDELRRYIGQGFFSFDIHDMKRRLHARPWTASVSVRRIWPDRARVTVIERQPVARWDDQHLLSDTAEVFQADPGAFADLPQIYAAGGDPVAALNLFVELQQHFAAVGETLVALAVDNRGATDLELNGGLEIKLGRDDIDRKVERLVRIYREQIQPRRGQIARLDLRYSNGFAVAWRPEVLTGMDKASIWSNSNV